MAYPPSAPQASGPGRHRIIAIACLVGVLIVAFAAKLALAIELEDARLFSLVNVFFDADPPRNLYAIAHGNGLGLLSHPGSNWLFSPWVRAADTLVFQHLVDAPPERRREAIALLISPLASTGTTALLYLTVRRLVLSVWTAFGVALLYCVAFSSFVFGVVPESYAVSALCLTAVAFVLASRDDHPWLAKPATWVALFVVTSAVTISNGLLVWLGFAVDLHTRGHPPREIVRRCAQLLGFGLPLLGLVSLPLLLAGTGGLAEGAGWLSRFASLAPASALRGLMDFVLIQPRLLVGFWYATSAVHFGSPDSALEAHSFIGTLAGLPSLLTAAALLATGVWGARRLWRGTRVQRAIALYAGGVWIGNSALHAVFGREVFLYGQHWLFALLLLLCGTEPAGRTARSVALGAWLAVSLAAVVSVVAFYGDVL